MVENKAIFRLLETPLFFGLSQSDLTEIMLKARFEFRHYKAGKQFIVPDTPSEKLTCILEGATYKEKLSHNKRYVFREYYTQPIVIQAERLFGLRQRYDAAFFCQTNVLLFCISKDDVRDLLFHFMPFQINFLNMICTTQHLWEGRLWQSVAPKLELQFLHFLLVRCSRPAGRKELLIDMLTLAEELRSSRLAVSKMLKALQKRGHIEYRRERIIIPAFEALLQDYA